MRTAVIALEGVMMNADNQTPQPIGTLLYRALETQFRLAVVCNSLNIIAAERWLQIQGLTEHLVVSPKMREDPIDLPKTRMAQVQRLRKQGLPPDLLIDSEPDVVRLLVSNGVNAILAAFPEYMSPKNRPDYKSERKPWNELVYEIEQQRILKKSDDRLIA